MVLEAIVSTLAGNRQSPPSDLSAAALNALENHKRCVQSTLLRLRTVEKRMSNVIQLSYAQATQADSHIMKFIAFLTLVFLPATAVASILSTPFFDIDWNASGAENNSLRTARSFWKFWVIAIPLTVIAVSLCLAWIKLPIKAYLYTLADFVRNLGRLTTGKGFRTQRGNDIEMGTVL